MKNRRYWNEISINFSEIRVNVRITIDRIDSMIRLIDDSNDFCPSNHNKYMKSLVLLSGRWKNGLDDFDESK